MLACLLPSGWAVGQLREGGLECNNKMLLANKIKESEECITSKALGFRTFLDSLRQARSSAVSNVRPSQPSIHESEPLPEHEHPSEANLSEVLHYDRSQHQLERPLNNLSSGMAGKAAEGDRAIRNKLRVGVANRQRANCFRLPAYCFEPTKLELGDHLKQVKKDTPKLMVEVGKRGRAQREEDFSDLMEKKGLSGDDRARKISALNANLVLKYCSIHQISSISSLKDVLVFFTRLLEVLNFSLPEPKIERYKNCVFFGQPIRKNQIYEGIVYYYSGVVYFGELFNSQRNGVGVEVDLAKGTIHKGEFRDGEMVGFFEVQKEGQKYFGELSDGKYHGRGKLVSAEEVFEGEFREGRKVYGSTHKQNNKKEPTSSRVERRDMPFWSAEKDLNSSRTERLEFSNNKIRPVRNLNVTSNIQIDSERKRQSRRYAEQTREFSYALNHEMEGGWNPEASEMINSKRGSRVAAMRIREVGKLHSSNRQAQAQAEEDEERPLINKL